MNKTINFICISLAPIIFSGCTMLNYPTINSDVGTIKKSNIVWTIVDNPDNFCRVKLKINTIYPILACTNWKGENCFVYTDKSPSYEILGHEIRHCFDKHWHD